MFFEELLAGRDDLELFQELYADWANSSFTMRPDALQQLYRLALQSKGPILECGCGVSTVVLSAAATRAGTQVYALENISRYLGQVQDRTQGPVEIFHCPLERGWYDLNGYTSEQLPNEFGLLVVDGPQVLEKRCMALEVFYSRIQNADVFMDDVHLPMIAQPFNRWVLDNRRVAQRFGTFAITRAQ